MPQDPNAGPASCEVGGGRHVMVRQVPLALLLSLAVRASAAAGRSPEATRPVIPMWLPVIPRQVHHTVS